MTTKKQEVRKVPNLRFPGFEGEWESNEIGQLMKIGSGKDYKHLSEGDIPVFGTGGLMTSVNDYLMDGESVCIGRKGTINKPFYYSGKFWTVDTLFFTHSFKNIIPKFAFYTFEKINWLKYNEASGVPSLSKSTIEQIETRIPSISEQKIIANFLSLIDERIQCQIKIIEELKSFKSAVSKKIFSQELRFKDDNGEDFAEWEEKKLGECLDYEQPTKYLVTSTEYEDKYETPVVTAGKTFILGYTNETTGIFEQDLPVIIFDDFTTSTQFVNFPFKAKSSAMKILKATEGLNTRFIYEALQMINYEIGGHGRHWISVYEKLEILIPSYPEQAKIADFLTRIDEKIELETSLLQQLKLQKQYFLSQMFI